MIPFFRAKMSSSRSLSISTVSPNISKIFSLSRTIWVLYGIWTPDTEHYPLARGYKKADMQPASFTAEELLKHAKAAGVDRVNLIQMSYYGFEKQLTI